MQTRRDDLRAAVLLTAASYMPIVCAIRFLGDWRPSPYAGSAWGVGAMLTAGLGYMLTVDALLPLGRSKIDLARGALRRTLEALSTNGWWRARVVIALSCAVVVQVACELAANR